MGVGANRVMDNSAARTKRGNRWASREKGFQAEVGPVVCYDNERGVPRVTPKGIGDWGLGIGGSMVLSERPSLLTPHSSLLTPHSSLLTPHSSLLTPHSSLLNPPLP